MPPVLVTDTLEDLFPQERTGGRHVSSAIHRVMRAMHPDRFTDEPIDMVRGNLGNAVERVIAQALERKYPRRYILLDEIELDDIHGHVDLFDTEEMAVVEIKYTIASSRRADDVEDPWFWRYWAQGRAYAKMLGVTRVVLIIVFAVGDWKTNIKPRAFQWQWDFTQEEIDETWEMVKAYAEEEEGQSVRRERSVRREGNRSRGRKAAKAKPRSRR